MPVLRTNHAVRGVLAPAGRSEIRFTYRPDSVVRGLVLMATALLGLVAFALWTRRSQPALP